MEDEDEGRRFMAGCDYIRVNGPNGLNGVPLTYRRLLFFLFPFPFSLFPFPFSLFFLHSP